jgi:hypothetical protein
LSLAFATRELQQGMAAIGVLVDDEKDPIQVGLWSWGDGLLGLLEEVDPGFDGHVPLGARGLQRPTGLGWGVGGSEGG